MVKLLRLEGLQGVSELGESKEALICQLLDAKCFIRTSGQM